MQWKEALWPCFLKNKVASQAGGAKFRSNGKGKIMLTAKPHLQVQTY
jgi:hypothetical protein